MKPELLRVINVVIVKLFPVLSMLLKLQFLVIVKVRLQNQRYRRQNSNKLALPIIIIVTLIIFTGSPHIAVLINRKVLSFKNFVIYFNLVTRFNVFSDALIYVFMLPAIRIKTNRKNRVPLTLLRRKQTPPLTSASSIPVENRESVSQRKVYPKQDSVL